MARGLILALGLWTFACTPLSREVPTSTASGTDSELEAAIRQARDSLDTFIAKITSSHANRTFVAVKVRFTPPDEAAQDIWVDNVTYSNGKFRGDVGDDVPGLRLEAGEPVRIEAEEIVDWMIVEDGKLIGGYTIRLAVRRMSPEERDRFLETLDYSIED